MGYVLRRVVLAAGAGAVGTALVGCQGDGDDEWELDESIAVLSVTIFQGPNGECCEVYAEYLADTLETDVETVVSEDLGAIKPEYGIDATLQSCHTVELDTYVVEGHIPAEVIATLVEEEPGITGIPLPGMPAGTPGMGGTKSETWTVYEIDGAHDDEHAVYTEL